MRRGFLDGKPKAKAATAARRLPAPSQPKPTSASSSPVSEADLKTSLALALVSRLNKPIRPDIPFWTFLSFHSAAPEPNASCALLVTPASLEVAQATVPWLKTSGSDAGPVLRGKDNFDIESVEGKGMGMFATKDLAKGALVLEERPVLVFDFDHLVADHREAVLWHAFSHFSPDI